jgi:hypothetical protein
VGQGHFLDEVQPDPHADQVTVFLGLDTGEPLKQLTLSLWVDPETVVEDGDAPMAVGLRERDIDPAARSRAEASGVVEQFADCQVQPLRVGPNGRRQHVKPEIDG